MQYATQQDLIDRYRESELIQLTDQSGTGTIDAAVVGKALGDASNLIDGYVGSRYLLPLPATTPLLVRLCSAIARFYLYDEQPSEQVQSNYVDAIARLKDLAAGKLTLDAPTGDDPVTTDAPAFSTPARVFDRDTLAQF